MIKGIFIFIYTLFKRKKYIKKEKFLPKLIKINRLLVPVVSVAH